LEELPAGQSKAPGAQSKVGKMLPALSSACKHIASIFGVPVFPSQLRGAMYEHLRVVPPGKRLRVPSCTRPEILGSG
jgi:hypothetical protein